MKFGRKETIKSFDTEETDNNEPDSFRRKGKMTRRHKDGLVPASTIELDGELIRVTTRSSKGLTSDPINLVLPTEHLTASPKPSDHPVGEKSPSGSLVSDAQTAKWNMPKISTTESNNSSAHSSVAMPVKRDTSHFQITDLNINMLDEKKALESSRIMSNDNNILEKVQLLKQISISSDRGDESDYPVIKIGTFDDSEEIDMIIDYYIEQNKPELPPP